MVWSAGSTGSTVPPAHFGELPYHDRSLVCDCSTLGECMHSWKQPGSAANSIKALILWNQLEACVPPFSREL